jgi:hypothetical protein
VPHNSSLNAYTSPTGICANNLKPLTCTNGAWTSLGVVVQQNTFSSGCAEAPCQKSQIGFAPGLVFSNAFVTMYTGQIAFPNNQACLALQKNVQCVNGNRSGWVPGLYTGCVASGSPCSGSTVGLIGPRPHGSFATLFTQPQAIVANNESCMNLDVSVQCINGTRSGYNAPLYTGCQTIES